MSEDRDAKIRALLGKLTADRPLLAVALAAEFKALGVDLSEPLPGRLVRDADGRVGVLACYRQGADLYAVFPGGEMTCLGIYNHHVQLADHRLTLLGKTWAEVVSCV